MPIEIKELQITVEVSPRLTSSGQQENANITPVEQKEIVKIAVEKVMGIVKSKNER